VPYSIKANPLKPQAVATTYRIARVCSKLRYRLAAPLWSSFGTSELDFPHRNRQENNFLTQGARAACLPLAAKSYIQRQPALPIVKPLKMLIIMRWTAAHGVHHAKESALCVAVQIMLSYDVLPCVATSMQVEGGANVQNRL
jgi:hypothetical protein